MIFGTLLLCWILNLDIMKNYVVNASNNLDTQEIVLPPLDPKLFDICVNCWCKAQKSCSRFDCNGARTNVPQYFCGPLQISKGYWVDSGSPLLSPPSEFSPEQDDLEDFENCTKTLECAMRTTIQYANKFKKDCNDDGKFDCLDALLLHNLGPGESCLKKELPAYAKRVPSIYSCYLKRIEREDIVGPIIGSVVGFICVAIICFVIWKLRNRLMPMYSKRTMEASADAPKRVLRTHNKEAEINLPMSAIISPDDLVIDTEKCLGEGQFGMVYQGTFQCIPVAIKAPKLRLALSAVSELEKELEMMVRVGDHINIVRFYGAEISQIRRGIAYVVLELSPLGALLNYMRKVALQQFQKQAEKKLTSIEKEITHAAEETDDINYDVMLYWAEQIASGMALLEEKKVIHGDLASRNILLYGDNIVKISDFGFARNLGNYEEYEKKEGLMPWRWMALESLERRLFSIKSDVWSYGVTVWEIFTLGAVPYTEITGWTQDFLDGLRRGQRLPLPAQVSEEVYLILLKCWQIFSEERPTFLYLSSFFNAARCKALECKKEETPSYSRYHVCQEQEHPRYV